MISSLYKATNTLGESPFWHEERRSVFWVDIEQGLLHELRWDTRDVKIWKLKIRVSLILGETDGWMTLAVQGGLLKLELTTGDMQWLTDIEKHLPERRCNDGAIDSQGRIWVGVMDLHCKPGHGSLYRLENSGAEPIKMLEGLTIPNGLVWSGKGDRMYFVDTMSGCVKSYLFNPENGSIEYEKDSVVIPTSMGMPDGMAIDEEGMLWVALFGGFAVGRWNPIDGKLLNLIELPAPKITNCCFAGEKLDKLVVTSARENMSDEELAKYPESGGLFIIENPGAKGR